MYRRTGNSKEAIKAFDRAIELDPGHETSRFNKGIVLIKDMGDPEGALKAWEDLLRINPSAKAPNGQPVMKLVQRIKERPKP
jgi:tetratricopeptide (TPR) repeat protein